MELGQRSRMGGKGLRSGEGLVRIFSGREGGRRGWCMEEGKGGK